MLGVALLKDNACNAEALSVLEAEVLTEKGQAAYDQGAYEKATEALQRAVQLRDSARARYALGYVYRDNKAVTNNTQRAVDEFKAAVDQEPQNADYHASLADAYRQNNNLGGALVEFEQALALDSGNKQTRYFYGIALFQKGHYAEAAREFRAVMDADPNYRNISEMVRLATQRASYYRAWGR
jgi:tetratricopeptide (TPR) repeat protein